MNDRESIASFIKSLAHAFDDGPEASVLRTVAQQIANGDDLKPVEAPATVADLLGLNDLDLGALASDAGVGASGAQIPAFLSELTPVDLDHSRGWEEFVSQVATRRLGSVHTGSLRTLAALGAKVRAALSQKTSKVAEPRIAQSHEEAPCGSLWARASDGRLVMRLPNGRGCNVPKVSEWDSISWPWDVNNIDGDFPARLVAEGLTDGECRTLSDLNQHGAIMWCDAREAARRA